MNEESRLSPAPTERTGSLADSNAGEGTGLAEQVVSLVFWYLAVLATIELAALVVGLTR